MASRVLNTNPSDLSIIATNEKVTGPVAAEMLRRSLKDVSGDLEVLDMACGGGILTAEVLKFATEQQGKVKVDRILAADIDEKMIGYVQNRIREAGWEGVEAKKVDQQSMDLPNETFTHVFNVFGVAFCPNDEAALAETYRVLKSSGLAGFTSWKSITWWPTLAMPAIASHIPEATPLPAPATVFPARSWSTPEDIPHKLENGGFQDVQVSEYRFTPDIEAKEFAEACAVLTKVITRKFWSDEMNEKYGDRIEPALLKYLRENFPNGKWNEEMVAIISTGKKV